MKKIIVFIFAFLILGINFAHSKKYSPLNLNWGQKVKHPSGITQIENYTYAYGDPGWGQVRYYSKEDVIGLSTELVLYYSYGKLTSAALIFLNVNEINCIEKYKEITKTLEFKYGKFINRIEVKDPIVHDLIFYSPCIPIKIGINSVVTKWKNKQFRIESYLFGDENSINVEVEYYFLKLENLEKEEQIKKYIKAL
jgi:hypothetical protein